MARIAYFAHGRGRGHASRQLSIARALDAAGHEVHPFGGGDGASFGAQLPRFREVAPVWPGPGSPLRFARRVARDRAALRALSPALVITDGDPAAAAVARMHRLPLLAIGHDLVFGHCELPPGLPFHLLAAQRANALPFSVAPHRRVAVHFLPVRARDAATVVARPDVRPGLRADANTNDAIAVYFRDDNGRRVEDLLRRHGQRVVRACGNPDRFAEQLSTCRAVVASAGSTLLAECVLLGKPLLALHRRRDPEQTMNAALAARAGVAVAAAIESVNEATIDQFLRRVDGAEFARVDLARALPAASEAAVAATTELV